MAKYDTNREIANGCIEGMLGLLGILGGCTMFVKGIRRETEASTLRHLAKTTRTSCATFITDGKEQNLGNYGAIPDGSYVHWEVVSPDDKKEEDNNEDQN